MGRPIQKIELSPSPGQGAGDLITIVTAGSGLAVPEAVVDASGCYSWDFLDVDPRDWDLLQPLLSARIAGLKEAGMITYGSW